MASGEEDLSIHYGIQWISIIIIVTGTDVTLNVSWVLNSGKIKICNIESSKNPAYMEVTIDTFQLVASTY
jgi:hypothetical protein